MRLVFAGLGVIPLTARKRRAKEEDLELGGSKESLDLSAHNDAKSRRQRPFCFPVKGSILPEHEAEDTEPYLLFLSAVSTAATLGIGIAVTGAQPYLGQPTGDLFTWASGLFATAVYLSLGGQVLLTSSRRISAAIQLKFGEPREILFRFAVLGMGYASMALMVVATQLTGHALKYAGMWPQGMWVQVTTGLVALYVIVLWIASMVMFHHPKDRQAVAKMKELERRKEIAAMTQDSYLPVAIRTNAVV